MGVAGLFNCILGPRIFRIYRGQDSQTRIYSPNAVEGICDNFVRLVSFTFYASLYLSPLWGPFLSRRMSSSSDNLHLYGKIMFTLTAAWASALVLRGLGRLSNADYLKFLEILQRAQGNQSSETLQALRRYDCEFHAWPATFRWNESKLIEADPHKVPTLLTPRAREAQNFFQSTICGAVGYVASRTIGRWMMHPGSVSLLQTAISPALSDGRKKLVDEFEGQRNKLIARDGNQIDTMFVDRRGKGSNGKYLVICCEGNAGFYEIGTTITPIEANYSVLGWNHPGFMGSTGLPFPQQEINAMDVVIHFAVTKLGFKMDEIYIFAWSIGGFPATWAGTTYPELAGIILDASFDDVLPLAMSKMPQSWKPLVRSVIRNHLNLNVGEQLKLYNGPVLLIRRTKEEIICTNERNSTGTNRINNLLEILLTTRFPKLLESSAEARVALQEWFAGDRNQQLGLLRRLSVDEALWEAKLVSYMQAHEGPQYPVSIGPELNAQERIQLVLFLASKHWEEFDATHCVPLPASHFKRPYDLLGKASSDSGAKSNL